LKTSKVVIINYNAGNLLSVQRAFEYCGVKAELTSDHKKILSASKVVLPGVGAFGAAMGELKNSGLDDVIKEIDFKKIPLLGICLGMQLLMQQSEEFGNHNGLGLIQGKVIPIPPLLNGKKVKIPHIGWNILNKSKKLQDKDFSILDSVRDKDFFYFVHSYMVELDNLKNLLATADYGGHKITSMLKKDSIIGCQFHPEKSGEVGLKIINNFINSKG